MSKLINLDNTPSFIFKALAASLLGSTILLAGCATKPTYNSTGPKVQVNAQGIPNMYKVKRGDTVSDIAARYGLNYRQIGALNRLDSRYTIYTGQWLRLWDDGNRTAQNSPPKRRPTYTPPQTRPVTPAPVPQPTPSQPVNQGYIYPSTNPVIKNYNANAGDMGMWFGGRVGDPIIASNAGTVMYAGNGLPEYGNLIMIRHDDRYVSVYAHNNQMLVKEGDRVQKGQRIATMGSSGQTNQVALQFQIRENGKPIDPKAVLNF